MENPSYICIHKTIEPCGVWDNHLNKMANRFNRSEAEQMVINRVKNLKNMGYDMYNHDGVFRACRTDLLNTYETTKTLVNFINKSVCQIIIKTGLLIRNKPISTLDIFLEEGFEVVSETEDSLILDLPF